MGTGGTGFLYVSRNRARSLRPNLAGWLSSEDDLRYLLDGPGFLRYDRPIRKDVRVFESGNHNSLGSAGLDASVSLIQSLGVPAIFAHIQRYLDALEAILTAAGFRSVRSSRPDLRSCILSVLPPKRIRPADLQQQLLRERICCATPEGYLRFSPHWCNPLDEAKRVGTVLARKGRRLRH
jgi:selenocysteine lyase/cysteine desulfurase